MGMMNSTMMSASMMKASRLQAVVAGSPLGRAPRRMLEEVPLRIPKARRRRGMELKQGERSRR